MGRRPRPGAQCHVASPCGWEEKRFLKGREIASCMFSNLQWSYCPIVWADAELLWFRLNFSFCRISFSIVKPSACCTFGTGTISSVGAFGGDRRLHPYLEAINKQYLEGLGSIGPATPNICRHHFRHSPTVIAGDGNNGQWFSSAGAGIPCVPVCPKALSPHNLPASVSHS